MDSHPSGSCVSSTDGDSHEHTDLRCRRREVRIGRFGNAEAFRDFFKQNYGPTIAVYRNLGFDTDKVVALDADLVELGRRFGADDGTMKWEYLLVTAQRR